MKKTVLMLVLLTLAIAGRSGGTANDSLARTFLKEKDKQHRLTLMLGTARKIQHTQPQLLKEIGIPATQLAQQLKNQPAQCEALLMTSLYYYHKDQFDSALTFQNQALELAEQLESDTLRAMIFDQLGLTKFNMGLYREALGHARTSLAYYKKIKGWKQTGIFNNLASCFSSLGQYDSAIYYFFRALRSVSESPGDQNTKGIILGNIGREYSNKNDHQNAILFYRQAIGLLKKSNTDLVNLANFYVNLGVTYRVAQQTDSALHYFNLGRKAYLGMNASMGVARVALNMGNLLTDLKKYDEAKASYTESLKICLQDGIQQGIAMNYINLGFLYNEQKLHTRALVYFKLADSLVNTTDEDLRLSILNGYYQIYKSTGHHGRALNYLEQHAALLDSINTRKHATKLEELHNQYTNEIKDHENQLLKNENEIKQKSIEYHKLLNYVFLTIVLLILVAIVQIVRSRARLKKLYDKLENKRKTIEKQALELEIANHTKDKLFSVIAHDLRNPFNSILGMADVIEEETRTPAHQELNDYAVMLRKSAQKAYDLLENLLLWSKAQQGLIKPNLMRLHLNQSIEEVVTLLQPQANKLGVILINQVADPLAITADAELLNTILRNLTTNALKHTPRGGKIEISSTTTDTTITISVSDTGTGMKPQQLLELFNDLTNINPTSARNSHSSGFGLLISHEFAHMMGGTLTAESTQGIGTTVYLTLPANNTDAEEIEP